MATEIALVDGTTFQVGGSVRETLERIGDPTPNWVFLAEDEDALERYFNPASVACVIGVEESDGMPLIEMH